MCGRWACRSTRTAEDRFRIGDRVIAFIGYGGYTTELVTKEDNVAPLPRDMDFITGASFVLAYGTADYALRVRREGGASPPAGRRVALLPRQGPLGPLA